MLSECVWQQARICCSCYRIQKIKNHFPMHSRSSGQPKNDVRALFSIFRHIPPVILASPGILANATVVAFVLLCSSRFTFHGSTQHEATPTHKLAWKWLMQPFATSCMKDYEGHFLTQTSFTELSSSSCPALC